MFKMFVGQHLPTVHLPTVINQLSVTIDHRHAHPSRLPTQLPPHPEQGLLEKLMPLPVGVGGVSVRLLGFDFQNFWFLETPNLAYFLVQILDTTE